MCQVPPDETRSTTSRSKSQTHNTVQHSAMINDCAPKSITTPINRKTSVTTSPASSITLKDAPVTEACVSKNRVTPQKDVNQSTLPSLLTPVINCSTNLSMCWWSGALPNDCQLFPNLEDARGAYAKQFNLLNEDCALRLRSKGRQ